MNKLNEPVPCSSTTDVRNDEKKEEDSVDNEKTEEEKSSTTEEAEKGGEMKVQTEEDRKEILRFTMLFNKYSGVLDVKRNSKSDENKYAMFFNKGTGLPVLECFIQCGVPPQCNQRPPVEIDDWEVTVRQKPEGTSSAIKSPDIKPPAYDRDLRVSRPVRTRSKFCSQNVFVAEPQISDPAMMFSSSLSPPEILEWNASAPPDNLKRFLNKRNADELAQNPTASSDLRVHNSLTSLSIDNSLELKVKSKIPSLTALDTNMVQQKSGLTRFSYWDHWDDLTLMQSDVDKRLNLQISRSSNDNNRRCAPKLKKEDAASVSDSKLLYADMETKKHIKKYDKKSRGDSFRKEKDNGSRKQVQWKTEVDVIYFSSHLAANGDRTGEVLGRVMEPLREEWEQQRKGFYTKLVSSHMESHLKDRFISLLNI